MKKSLSVLLAFVMLFTSMSISFTAFAKMNENGTEMVENPFYSGEFRKRTGMRNATKMPKSSASVKSVYDGVTYYSYGDTLIKKTRDALGARKKSVKLRLFSNYRYYYFDFLDLREDAFIDATEDEISVSSTDGDYARWSVRSYNIDYELVAQTSKGYYYEVDLGYTYYSTDSQEHEVDGYIKKVVDDVRRMGMSDYETLLYLHDFICDNARYNYEATQYPSSYLDAYTAYGILCEGYGVCQGYATAFYRICKELGFSVRVVTSEPHAWNLVKIGNYYYFVDLTWDDQIQDEPEIVEMYNASDVDQYFFFLVDYNKLRSEDNGDGSHDLEYYYDTDYYSENYRSKTAKKSYDYYTQNGLSTCSVSIPYISYTYNGNTHNPNVTVRDKNGNRITDYSVSYSSTTNPGRALIKIKGTGAYAGEVIYRTFNVLPSKVNGINVLSADRKTNQLTLNWNSVGSGTSYKVQMYKNGAWVTVKTTTSNSAVITGLSSNHFYNFRIRAYKSINNYTYYGAYSSTFKTLTRAKTPSISLSTKSRAITVNWNKVSCSGYEVQYSKNSDMSSAKSVKVSNSATSKKLSSLTKGKRYYVRVRAYTNYNGKTYNSSWSSKKSIVVK